VIVFLECYWLCYTWSEKKVKHQRIGLANAVGILREITLFDVVGKVVASIYFKRDCKN